ncbi:Haloacid Dehalogenase Superfamily Class (subfamily) IIA [Amycolatopsis marina]|uniref:Haloacid Dehalogenase Superfamily Class (Subfamily) IIA n=1 Tax=Amycolatopsis marina TaxID=490629 RepID=A0A1I0ZHF6_9PSEU|nr:HAD-IIA family hydrolase [Amycolatopsis marina]SFB23633.1 Haloacid Dehalogenase Superfamily Class (subfamily) IIA [Amycolatopsis marina]
MSEALLARHDAVLLDLDGTVYHGARVIPGAPEAVAEVRRAGVPVRFVTNNASKAPESVAEHLRSLGVAAEPGEVSTSSQAAAAVLAERLRAGSRVLVVGTGALAAEVEALGLAPVRKMADDVAAVVQGHSPDTTWADLAEACLAIRAGVLWVACNVDATLPTERGQLPGNGSMVAALRTATDAEPVVAGKPEAPLFTAAATAVRATSALVVGDRLDTDIAGASAAGLDALAVLSGVATPRTLLTAAEGLRPRYLAEHLSAVTGRAGELEIGPRPGWRIRAEGDTLRVTAVTESDGVGDRLDLLRAVCDAAWRHGTHRLVPEGDDARGALDDLGLT